MFIILTTLSVFTFNQDSLQYIAISKSEAIKIIMKIDSLEIMKEINEIYDEELTRIMKANMEYIRNNSALTDSILSKQKIINDVNRKNTLLKFGCLGSLVLNCAIVYLFLRFNF